MSSSTSGGAFYLPDESADRLAEVIEQARPGWSVSHDADGWHAVHEDGTTRDAPSAGLLNQQLAEHAAAGGPE